jgi:hypothetical protein
MLLSRTAAFRDRSAVCLAGFHWALQGHVDVEVLLAVLTWIFTKYCRPLFVFPKQIEIMKLNPKRLLYKVVTIYNNDHKITNCVMHRMINFVEDS